MRLDRKGELPLELLTELITENRWIAQRYGVHAFFGDWMRGGGWIDIHDYAGELVDELAPARCPCAGMRGGDAPCADHHPGWGRRGPGRSICTACAASRGDREEEALRRVVDLVLADTREGIEEVPG